MTDVPVTPAKRVYYVLKDSYGYPYLQNERWVQSIGLATQFNSIDALLREAFKLGHLVRSPGRFSIIRVTETPGVSTAPKETRQVISETAVCSENAVMWAIRAKTNNGLWFGGVNEYHPDGGLWSLGAKETRLFPSIAAACQWLPTLARERPHASELTIVPVRVTKTPGTVGVSTYREEVVE